MELTKNCTGCMACYNKCPNNAISIIYSEAGFYTPYIDKNKCTNCGLCNSVCPQQQNQKNQNEPTTCYAVMAEDKIRKNSASGGLFAMIAKEYLKNGGYVCGAAFSNNFRNVNHIIINREEDLIRLQNSKYVQSNIGNSFKKIKALLEEGKEVLFGGTPCQVAGLNNYLSKSYDNLITMDLICHGIPSPLVWEKYLDELSKGKKVTNVYFRNKKSGWHYKPKVEISIKNGLFKKNIKDGLFYRGFFEHLILNESCYSCNYTNLHRPADITIGDFWGIERNDSDMDDNNGTSLLIIHSKKGQEVIDKYRNKFKKIKEFDISCAVAGNPRLTQPSERNFDCSEFIKNLKSKPIIQNIKESLCPKYEGIIRNFWICSNFGATLSAYAIQQYFKEKGKNYYLLRPHYPSGYTKQFAEKYLKTTHLVSNKTQYKELNKCTNNFVKGTDQVLRPSIIEEYIDTDFFRYTNFNKKRIIFSGSFGMRYLENIRWLNNIKYKKLFKRFDAVSTREISGVDICRDDLNINAECIIDPVFLIDKNKWYKMAPDTQDKYKNKIICYMIHTIYDSKKLHNYLKQKYNKDIVTLINKEMPIDEFLTAIKDADAVVTDSFHGACFSLIFNKKVLVITNSATGDARFTSLIEKFDIEPLTVNDIDDVYVRNELFEDYDSNKIGAVIEKECKKADLWFNQNVDNKKRMTIKNIIAELNFYLFSLFEIICKFIINKYMKLKFILLCKFTNKKILLWGASLYLADLLSKNKKMAKNILGIVDNNPARHYKKFCGCMVYPPETIMELKPKLIISTIKNNHEKAYSEIKEYIQKNHPTVKMHPDLFE